MLCDWCGKKISNKELRREYDSKEIYHVFRLHEQCYQLALLKLKKVPREKEESNEKA